MHKDNTPNFQTKLSKLTYFNDFVNHAEEEKDELKKVKRSFTKNAEGTGTDIGNKTKYKYNKVTRKMDNDSLPEIQDDIKALDDLGAKDPKHKYKIVSNLHQESHDLSYGQPAPLDDLKANFRSWELDHNTEEDAEELSRILQERHPEVDGMKLRELAYDWCGCECNTNESSSNTKRFIKAFEEFSLDKDDMHIGLEQGTDVEFESPADTQSYMFFGNLETIERMTSEMLEMNQDEVNTLLNNGHNWAEDHISTAKEVISHVYDFLNNKFTNENHEMDHFEETENYMFFANIENIHDQVSELIELDHQDVDDLLLDGHDWAEDHIASAKEKISQVYDLLKSEIN